MWRAIWSKTPKDWFAYSLTDLGDEQRNRTKENAPRLMNDNRKVYTSQRRIICKESRIKTTTKTNEIPINTQRILVGMIMKDHAMNSEWGASEWSRDNNNKRNFGKIRILEFTWNKWQTSKTRHSALYLAAVFGLTTTTTTTTNPGIWYRIKEQRQEKNTTNNQRITNSAKRIILTTGNNAGRRRAVEALGAATQRPSSGNGRTTVSAFLSLLDRHTVQR